MVLLIEIKPAKRWCYCRSCGKKIKAGQDIYYYEDDYRECEECYKKFR